MADVTRVVANVTRHETVVYMLEGAYDMEGAEIAIQSAEYDPIESKIHTEDIDVVALEVRTR